MQPCFGEAFVTLSHHESLLFSPFSDERKSSVVIFFIWFPSFYFFISPIVLKLQILFCYSCLKALCQKGGFDALKKMNIGNQNLTHFLFWVIRIEICPALNIEPCVHQTFILQPLSCPPHWSRAGRKYCPYPPRNLRPLGLVAIYLYLSTYLIQYFPFLEVTLTF
ncbi:ABC transporter [Bacillus pseudomycoides]|nr:ABC transporter [Bacillus pseudomycoides]